MFKSLDVEAQHGGQPSDGHLLDALLTVAAGGTHMSAEALGSDKAPQATHETDRISAHLCAPQQL